MIILLEEPKGKICNFDLSQLHSRLSQILDQEILNMNEK